MAEPLKNFFDAHLVRRLAATFLDAAPNFPMERFVGEAVLGLSDKELLDRGRHIALALARALPSQYEEAIGILMRSLDAPLTRQGGSMSSFFYLPHTVFVAEYGLSHFELSMQAQHALTQRFTAEFSIRHFLLKDAERTLSTLRNWASDNNKNVRRLVSEGTRPRLPWAVRLPAFVQDPSPVLSLLEMLKDDPEEYVRRSVANSLNDIAKDHPDLAVEVCKRWLRDASPERTAIVRHALRWLVKRGHSGALSVMGAGERPRIRLESASVTPAKAGLGDEVLFGVELVSEVKKPQKLMVDYVVSYPGANGKLRPKVFKLKKLVVEGQKSARLEGRVSLVDLTTRKHHPGEHRIQLRVNGVDFEVGTFELSHHVPQISGGKSSRKTLSTESPKTKRRR